MNRAWNVEKHVEILEIKTENVFWQRIHNKLENTLMWANEFKQYDYDSKSKQWHTFTKRHGHVESTPTCYLEIEYEKYLREEKLKRLIE